MNMISIFDMGMVIVCGIVFLGFGVFSFKVKNISNKIFGVTMIALGILISAFGITRYLDL